jgi:hypothetical protein
LSRKRLKKCQVSSEYRDDGRIMIGSSSSRD